ncbi:hypothetical protein [Streptomyces sp. NPDC046821]|uniref:hypothetical protein n=1 Tax=Streptomyces sp. NPDC046821 TaxID=3154702 RepID=UPI0033EC994F
MTDVEELLDGVPVRLASAQAVRGRGERRRTRRRVGATVAVVAAVAVGFSSWTALSTQPQDAQVASGGDNPFMSHGVVQTAEPSQLPRYKDLRWVSGDPRGRGMSKDSPLPQAGLEGSCVGWPAGVKAPGEQYTLTYHGEGGAVGRDRISKYDSTSLATDATRALGQTLRNCGLKTDRDGHFTGVTNGDIHLRMEVSVRRWGTWVGVTEVQWRPAP